MAGDSSRALIALGVLLALGMSVGAYVLGYQAKQIGGGGVFEVVELAQPGEEQRHDLVADVLAERVGQGDELEVVALRGAADHLPHVDGYVAMNVSPATLLRRSPVRPPPS